MSRREPITDGAQLQQAWSRGEPDGYEDAGAVSAEEAGYLPPEAGPFACENCSFFVADGQPCQKVAEPIQAQGVCSLFEKREGQDVPAGDSAGAESDATASYQ